MIRVFIAMAAIGIPSLNLIDRVLFGLVVAHG